MRKSRAIFLLITLVVAIGGYVAWAAWDPAPTLQSMTFSRDVDADARSAAEADFRSHPPKALTWQRFWNRLIHPYEPREEKLIQVRIVPLLTGSSLAVPFLAIYYPGEYIFLARSQDGRWQMADGRWQMA